jgi:hypothetical protein
MRRARSGSESSARSRRCRCAPGTGIRALDTGTAGRGQGTPGFRLERPLDTGGARCRQRARRSPRRRSAVTPRRRSRCRAEREQVREVSSGWPSALGDVAAAVVVCAAQHGAASWRPEHRARRGCGRSPLAVDPNELQSHLSRRQSERDLLGALSAFEFTPDSSGQHLLDGGVVWMCDSDKVCSHASNVADLWLITAGEHRARSRDARVWNARVNSLDHRAGDGLCGGRIDQQDRQTCNSARRARGARSDDECERGQRKRRLRFHGRHDSWLLKRSADLSNDCTLLRPAPVAEARS